MAQEKTRLDRVHADGTVAETSEHVDMVNRFRMMVEKLRGVAEKGDNPGHISPLAQMWRTEVDGGGRRFIKSVYMAGGISVVPGALREVLDRGMSPDAVVEECDAILAIEDRPLVTLK